MKNYEIRLTQESPFGNEHFSLFEHGHDLPDDGWEKWSLPIGNGYMGVNVFGRVKTERLQITENSLSNPYANKHGGLNNFCELSLDFDHENVQHYVRTLSVNKAVATTSYTHEGIHFQREHFTSYPDKVFVTKLSASEGSSVSCTIRPEIPYVKPYLFEEGDGMGKSGQVTVSNDTITLAGEMEFYGIQFEGQVLVIPSGGELVSQETTIQVNNADSVVIIMAVGTNYKLEQRVFLEQDPKKKLAPYPHPHDKVSEIIKSAKAYSYDELLERHQNDYCPIIERAQIDLGGVEEPFTTDELLEHYRSGKRSRYLEELYFQYGRYLLIASSRPGTYPANLQGTWNKYDSTPWSSGYWHNINVQMNYWPAFNTNLLEMFEPYVDYFKAYLPSAEQVASEYVAANFPQNHSPEPGGDGWIIGTGAWLYRIFGIDKPFSGHSGPGTGAFTSKLFWDYYAFTMDQNILRETTYPAVLSMSRFHSKVLVPVEDKLLVKYSASPEQMHEGKHYYTVGCAFDQQMIYENYSDTIKAAELLHDEDEFIEKLKEDVEKLDPVIVGKSGQVKEFREEEFYGDIGEYHHRHISHLVGLYPGTVINRNTPDWIKAAEVSLNLRGDTSTGWSTAHKINAWARVKNGNRAYDLLNMILSKSTLNNLWDTHPPFQIDGNFGATAGIAEMLMQSHEGYIHLLPALPDEWSNGSFSSLTARGNFEVSASWRNHKLTELKILAKSGGECNLFVGKDYHNPCVEDGMITLHTNPGESYCVSL